MYQVLLVDDDSFIIEALAQSVRSSSVNVITAASAREALKNTEAFYFDAMVTDISMPGMNGLELISHVHQSHPHIRIVALSNYDDFSLIKEALRRGACDYLRKSDINGETLAVILQDLLCRNIVGDQNVIDKVNALERSNICLEALHGRLPEHLPEKIQQKERAVPVLLYLHSNFPLVFNRRFREHLSMMDCLEFVQLSEQIWLLFLQSDTNSRQTLHSIRTQLLIQLTAFFNSLKNAVTYFGIYGEVAMEDQQILSWLTACEHRLKSAYYIGYGHIVASSACPEIRPADEAFFLNWFHRLREACKIEVGNVGNLLACYFDELNKRFFLPDDVNQHCYYMLSQMLAVFNKCVSDYPSSIGAAQICTFQELRKIMTETMESCIQLSRSMRSDIASAVEYIHTHYMEDIPLKKAAEISHMSPNHFCTLFKQENQCTFVEYINRFRIEKAKHMLASTAMRTCEAAEAVGIPDYRYFCRLFKRYTGYQPGDFRYSIVDDIVSREEKT